MLNEKFFDKFAEDLHDYLPTLSIDCVILGYKNEELHVLVLRLKDKKSWMLPGGFVKKDED